MEIYAYKCKKCGHLHYPYRMICAKCGDNEHNEFDPTPLPKTGKLVTFTFLHNPPQDFAVSKLCLGIVKLKNGLAITAQLKIPDPKIGMKVIGKVEIVRSTELKNQSGMVFYSA
ncbi:OB-fold domain-containing protein [bacterium]|nr:OB-fold domain-containing protein [bacterium]